MGVGWAWVGGPGLRVGRWWEWWLLGGAFEFKFLVWLTLSAFQPRPGTFDQPEALNPQLRENGPAKTFNSTTLGPKS